MRGQSYSNKKQSYKEDFQGGETKVMKKSLLSLLIFALIFTMAAPAFANTSEDLGEYGTAVDRLKSLGVVTGHGDGTFKANDSITRAEFAAMAVRLLGLEAAAQVAGGNTQYKDAIPAWAQGYVNVATQEGIIKGYADGTFKPSKTVSHGEALTMLVRVLGYEPSVKENASWPTNYLVVAAKIGLTTGVDVSGYSEATRGETALFSNNALTIGKMEQYVYGDSENYIVTSDTLLDELNATVTTKIVESAELTDNGLVQFVGVDAEKGANFTVANGKTLADLLGHEVEAIYVNGKLVFVNDAQPANLVVTGKLDAPLTTTGDVYLKDVEDAYTIAAGAVFYANDVRVSGPAVAAADSDVTLFLNEFNEVRFAKASEWQVDGEVVSSVTAATTYKLAKVATNAGVDFSVKADAAVTLNGNAASITDLGENDVVYARTVADAKGLNGVAANVVEAYSKKVTGEVTSKTTEDGERVVVDGTTYEASSAAYGTITVGNAYDLFLDKNNVVIKAVAVSAATTSINGIYVGLDSYDPVKDGRLQPTVNQAKFFDFAQGKVVTIDVEADANGNNKTVDSVYFNSSDVDVTPVDGKVVTVTLNNDGLVKKISENTRQPISASANDISGSKVQFAVGGNYYLTTDKTVVVDVYEYNNTANSSKLGLVTFEDVNEGDSLSYVLNSDDLTVKYIFVNEEGVTSTEATSISGVYVSSFSTVTADGTVDYVKVNVEGNVQTVEVEALPGSSLVKGEAINLTDADDKDGKYTIVETVSVGTETNFPADIASNGFAIGATKYITTADTQFYVVTVDALTTDLDLITGATIYQGQFNDVADLEGAGGSAFKIAVVTDGTLGDYTIAKTVVVYKQK